MRRERSPLEQPLQASPSSGVQLYTNRVCCWPHWLHLYSYIGMVSRILAQRAAGADCASMATNKR